MRVRLNGDPSGETLRYIPDFSVAVRTASPITISTLQDRQSTAISIVKRPLPDGVKVALILGGLLLLVKVMKVI